MRIPEVACWLLLIGMARGVVAQEPELIVEIEKREIFEGESVLYRVTVNHVENPTAPVLSGLADFDVANLGEQSLNSQQITIINGRRTEIIRRGMQYNYRLTPRKSGVFTLPAPTAKVGNDVLTGKEITLRVVAPEVQDVVILEMTTDRTSVYPMQPFELSLRILVKDLPGELSDRDPLTVQPKPPALTLGWLTDEQIPDGIDVSKSWRELLEPIVSRQGNGFQVNNIGMQSVFSLFDSQATGFHPTPKRTTRKGQNGEDAGYWEYRFHRKLISPKLGTYRFGPATVKGTFGDRFEGEQLVGRDIYALAKSVVVTVKDVPFDGRPESYIGAVGTFDVTAELAPTSARVGDPMTLTVALTGQGTLADARPPAISALPGIAESFRVYEATEDSTANSRRFTYSLRPLNTSVAEFPAIPVSFFDVETEEYVTRTTEPIELSIGEAETLSSSDIVAATEEPGSAANPIEASAGGIFANETALSSLKNESVVPSQWVITWVGLLSFWGVASLVIGRVRGIQQDAALQRRRSASSRMKAAFGDAARLLQQGNKAEACDAVRRSVAGLIADFADVEEAGITPRDAGDLLLEFGIEESLRERTVGLLNDCDAARYGAGSEDVSRLHTEGVNVADRLLTELKKLPGRPRKRSVHAESVSLFLITLFAAGCGAAPDRDVSRKFQEAEQAFVESSKADDFVRVARLYDQISETGFVSGAVLYNQGNAWMRAGKTGRAIASYRQAQRHRPRDPYLAANLKNALAACGSDTSSTPETGVAGYVFFWQNWLSYREKFLLASAILFLTVLLSLVGQLVANRIAARRFVFVGGLLCVIAVISAAWDWHRFELTIHGAVAATESVARKGNAESYEAAFTEPLKSGTEFVVLETRNDWLRVQVGDAGTGWLSERDVVVY